MTYEEFIDEYHKVLDAKPTFIRKGQALMNYLWEIWPSEYARITDQKTINGVFVDCYYKDEVTSDTLMHLNTQWINYPN